MQEDGWSHRRVSRALRQLRRLDYKFGNGEVLGSMCTEPHVVAREAHRMFLETNLGDPDHFPGVARMEQELLQEMGDMIHLPEGGAGRFLTGGTEANILALFMARELTGKRKVVLPDSAHFSFEKAAALTEMELRYVRCGDDGRADAKRMARAATKKDTALMVGVAGSTELGLVDPIEDLAAVANRRGFPLHVDAAFGGYVVPFLEAAGRRPRPFDFGIEGVSSVGLDPHKMGMATIPAGALFLRDGGAWEKVGVKTPYVSTTSQSTLMGTRPGASVAAAWAVHRHLGRAGYAAMAETCLDNAAYLAARLHEMDLVLVAEPELNVVTFHVDDPTAISAALQEKGQRVNIVPRFGAIRIVVMPHVNRHVIDRFVDTLRGVLA